MLLLCYQSTYPSSSSSRHHRVIATVTSWCHLHVGHGFVVAIVVSPLLSHCRGVVVAVMSLWCLRCHIVAVSSSLLQCRLHRRIVVVSSSPSWCRLHVCHSFIVAIAVSPSRRSRFCHCHCGVAFTSVVVLLLPLRCRLHVSRGFVIAVAVSPSLLHCRHFVVAIAVSPSCWSQFRHRHHGVAFTSVTVSSSSLQCCLRVSHGFAIAVVVSPSRRSQFHRHHCGVAFTSVAVLSLPSRCRLHHCIIAVSSSQSCRCGAFAVASSRVGR